MKKETALLLGLFLLLSAEWIRAASLEAIFSEGAMVSSRSTLASNAGIDVMKEGGNAIDGAVATAFALAVTYPSAGNIGGGGFAVIHFDDGRVVTQDHRETAPNAAYRDMYLDEHGDVIKGLSRNTLLATGVPGSVAGLLGLLEKYGSKSRQEVMAQAIKLAKEGFVLDVYLARHINRSREALFRNPAAKKKFSISGRALRAGDSWRQPDLARTLQLISEKGRDGFYAGSVADLIVQEMKKNGGIISRKDLENYKEVYRKPVHTSYRGYDVWTMGPPSSAVIVLQMLNMIEPYDLRGMGWGSSEAIHLMIEAQRRAYADRAQHLGDADFYDVPLDMLLDKQYAKTRFVDFDQKKASRSDSIFAGVSLNIESPETTHFSVIDRSGTAVSFTTTLNSPYGNKIVVPGTGILLNNEMDDFSSKPDTTNQFDLVGRKANEIAPRKRMLSSMSPTIVSKDGLPLLVTGSPGGSTILTTTLQVILNIVDHEMSLEDAVSLPRFHHQWKPDRIIYEEFAFSPDTLKNLEQMGHIGFSPWSYGRGIGDANSVMMKDGMLYGVKDPRAQGIAVGF